MNTNSAGPRPQIKGRSRPFRSLLFTTTAAFVLTGFIIPKADAVIVSYFNFEDSPTMGSPVDLTPDKTVAAGGDNPGGGVEPSTTNLTITNTGALQASTSGLLLNRTPGDNDTANPGLAVNLSRSSKADATISFSVNLEFYKNLSLSFATNNNGNGYGNVQLSWTFSGGGGSLPVQAMPTAGTQIVTFDLTGTNVDGDGVTPKVVTFTLTFTNGQSNGVDLQTVIDNIVLGGTVIPEPATVWGGLLGVCGLCWHQRRRLIGFLALRRA
jgi:hypothetical protein